MTTAQSLTENLLAVCGLPIDAVHFDIYDKESLPVALMYYTKHEFFEPGLPNIYVLPQGVWRIVGFANQLTDEEWSGIVEHKNKRYKDYRCTEPPIKYFDRSTYSGKSLMESHGLDNPLILEKI